MPSSSSAISEGMSSICVIPMMSAPDTLRSSSSKQLTLIQGRKKKRITSRKSADPDRPRISGSFAPDRPLASMILSHQPRSIQVLPEGLRAQMTFHTVHLNETGHPMLRFRSRFRHSGSVGLRTVGQGGSL